jgi:hypothetical protein
MKILHVGMFGSHPLGSDMVLKTGFLKNSSVYQEFNYREVARRSSLETMNRELAETARGFDLVFIGKGELVKPDTLAAIRKSGACVALCYVDLRPGPEPYLMENLKECDVFFMTSAGETLKSYFQQGKPGRAAFFFNPANPDLLPEYTEVPRSTEPPLFTGRVYGFMCEERWRVYRYLCGRRDIQIIGSPDFYLRNATLRRIYARFKPAQKISGRQYIEKIIKSRFGIGVSAFQDVKYYTSNRLAHYLTFGKLYLTYRFPGCEDFFRDAAEIVYYRDVKELGLKIEFYLKNQDLAEEVGRAGRKKMLAEYNAEKMVKMMLEIVTSGRSTIYPWVEVYK